MAKITLSDSAPAEAVHFTFAGEEFDLGGNGKKTFETDDNDVLANASVHPWLTVKYDAEDVYGGVYHDQLRPEDDPFSSAHGSIANDPEAARAADEAAQETTSNPVALDAGKVQTEPVTTDGVAETLAADPTSKTADKVEN